MSSDSTVSEKLAIHGGPKAVTNTLPSWPQFDEPAISAVESVLRSGRVNYWTGRQGMEFERRFAQWQGSRFAVSAATGTAALHVCLAALGIGPGDEVTRAQLHLHRHQLRGRAGGGRSALRGREPGRPLPQRRVGRETGHPADQSDHPGAPLRQRLRHGRHQCACQAARSLRDRGQRPGIRRRVPGQEDRHPGPHGRVQLLPEQDVHHRRRRRHGHDRRRGPRLGGAAASAITATTSRSD